MAQSVKTNWLVQIFDPTGKLVDIPQADILSFQLTDAINGGSGAGGADQILFARPFNKIGAVGFQYSVLFWFWPAGTTRPTNPYWGGYIVDFDQTEEDASGQVTAYLYGDFKRLDAAIVSEQINPGVSGNPSLDASAYISHLLTTYQPSTFGAPLIPSSMFALLAMQFDASKLGAAIDTVTKTGRDTSGLFYTWRVATTANLGRSVVVQSDQNPNVVSGVHFKMLFRGSQIREYKIQTKYRDIVNVVTIYGGKDAGTGAQAWGSYQDPTSVAEFGPWQSKLSVPALLSNAACQAYATVYFPLHAYPQAASSFKILQPDPTIVGGTWVQINEVPTTATQAAVYKQVRVSLVRISMSKDRLEQYLETVSPTPYLDDAIYVLGLNIAASMVSATKGLSVNRQTLFVRSGGYVTSSSTSPARVAIAPTQAVFPGSGTPLIVNAAALALTQLTDNSGGALNGQTGDGAYTVSINSSGSYIITKGPRPAETATLLNLVSCVVLTVTTANDTLLLTDIRTLTAFPLMPASVVAAGPTSTSIGSITYPNGVGATTYDAAIPFTLSDGTNAQPWLAQIELLVAASGAAVTTATRIAVLQPNATGVYTSAQGFFSQLGAGRAWDLYVRYSDGFTASAALHLGTTSANPLGAPSSGPTFTLTSTSLGTYTTGSTTYAVQASFTIAVSPDPAAYAANFSIVFCQVGAWNSSHPGAFPEVYRINSVAAGPTTYTNLNVTALPAGRPWELHLVLWDRNDIAYDAGLIGTTVAQTFDEKAQPKAPASSSFTVTGVSTSVTDVGLTAGLVTYNNPAILALFTIHDAVGNTVPLAGWCARFQPLVRVHNAGLSVTDATTYWQPNLKGGDYSALGVADGSSVQCFFPVSAGDYYDIALQILDGQGIPVPGATTCVSIATNVQVPTIGGGVPYTGAGAAAAGRRFGQFIAAGHLKGDTTGDIATAISDGTQLVHPMMSAAAQQQSRFTLNNVTVRTDGMIQTALSTNCFTSASWNLPFNAGASSAILKYEFVAALSDTNNSFENIFFLADVTSGTPANGYLFERVDTAGHWNLYKFPSSTTAVALPLGVQIAATPDTNRHRYAISIVNPSGTATISLYIDGVLVTQGTDDKTTHGAAPQSGHFGLTANSPTFWVIDPASFLCSVGTGDFESLHPGVQTTISPAGGVLGTTTINGVSAAIVVQGAQRANLGLDSAGDLFYANLPAGVQAITDISGNAKSSTIFNTNLPNLLGLIMPTDFALTYTFPTGTTNFSFYFNGAGGSGNAVHFLAPDGVTTFTAPFNSTAFGTSGTPRVINIGSGSGSIAYLLFAYKPSTDTWSVIAQTTPLTNAQLRAANTDGWILVTPQTASGAGTTATIGGGGGGGRTGGRLNN